MSGEVPSSSDGASDLKSEIQGVKKDLQDTLLNVFEQISFVVEAEDIMDFVDEKSNDIKSSLDVNFKEILSSLDDLHGSSNSSEGNRNGIPFLHRKG